MKIKRTGILLFAIMLLLTGCGRGSTAANDESFVGQIGEMDLQDAGLGEEEAASETVNAADEETETEMAAEAVTDETAEEDAAAGMAEPGTGAETAAGETEGVSLENVDWEGLAIKRGDLFYPFDSVSVYGKYGIWADEEDQILILSKSVDLPAAEMENVPSAEEAFQPVPIDQLANYSSLKKRMTDEEFALAYQAALNLVAPYIGLPLEEQIYGITVSIRNLFDSGMGYSMSTPHYNDPYGYFILGTASCAGCTRATGLCLNILGIPYEHVNENQYSHQWCRINVNGTYWISDAYGLYCGPEPAPYMHPWF